VARKPEVGLVALDDALKVVATTNPQHIGLQRAFSEGLNERRDIACNDFCHMPRRKLLEFCFDLVCARELGAL